jgi:hypothetical protein
VLPRSETSVLAVDPVGLTVPPQCACCGAVAGASRVETRPDGGASLLVPYCAACHRHAAAAATRKLAATLASCLLAGTLAPALPVLLPTVSLALLAALGLALVLLPVTVGAWWGRRPGAGHTANGPALWWLETGELSCTNPAWAAELARRAGTAVRRRHARERMLSAWMASGPILLLVLLPFFHWLLRPAVRVMNLTEASLTVLVDGRPVARIEPTSAESPAAGAELHLLAGARHLVAHSDDGQVVDDVRVVVRAGREHLYAPGSPGSCFWLETVGYGAQAEDGPVREPLAGATRFWTLPDIDAWFAPNPPPARGDRRSTGGTRVALRQARCSDVPAGGAE